MDSQKQHNNPWNCRHFFPVAHQNVLIKLNTPFAIPQMASDKKTHRQHQHHQRPSGGHTKENSFTLFTLAPLFFPPCPSSFSLIFSSFLFPVAATRRFLWAKNLEATYCNETDPVCTRETVFCFVAQKNCQKFRCFLYIFRCFPPEILVLKSIFSRLPCSTSCSHFLSRL